MIEIIRKYEELQPKYTRLVNGVKDAMTQYLEEESIPFFEVESRVKDEKSFEEKIKRKSYKDPLNEMEDIAGVRVICYYQDDLETINSIINEKFDILSQSNKYEEMASDQFGYASNHYIVQIEKAWMVTPNYSGLEDLKVEIQVRTILMHSWAAISHKLLYKREDDVPDEFKRKLNRLSALIELADEQFGDFKKLKLSYQDTAILDEKTAITTDSLLLLMSKYFDERDFVEADIIDFLPEAREYSGSISDFEGRIKRCLPILEKMEREESESGEYTDNSFPVWGLIGLARTVLDLTSDEYWLTRDVPEWVSEIRNKYRKRI